MTEPIIHDSTPQGSPILAYGQTDKRDGRFWLLLALPITLLVLLTGAAWYAFSRSTLPLPSSRAVVLFLGAHTPLPQQTPSLWRSAQRSAQPFPTFVGFAKNENNELYPFAVIPTVFGDTQTERTGIWRLMQEDNTASSIDLIHPRELVSSLFDYTAPVWLRIWPSRLIDIPNLEGNDSLTSIGGPIRNRRWHTDAVLQTINASSHANNPIVARQGTHILNFEQLPDVWPLFQEVLEKAGFLIHLDKPPRAVLWQTSKIDGKTDFWFLFSSPPNLETKAALAGAAGLIEYITKPLPDQTLIREERLPVEILREATTSEWIVGQDRVIRFEDSLVFIGHTSSTLPPPIDTSLSCPGSLLGVIQNSALNTWLTMHQQSLLPIDQLIWTEIDGKIQVCW